MRTFLQDARHGLRVMAQAPGFAAAMTLLAGVGVGLVGAFLAAQLLAQLPLGVSPADPITYVGVVALLSVVAAGACLVPARRALRVDPVQALRQ